jgi:uncharacterized protein YjbJ (UPF0337 family)
MMTKVLAEKPLVTAIRDRNSGTEIALLSERTRKGESRGERMNSDLLEAKWNRMRAKAKTWWGLLTDDDLARIGSIDELVGTLQERYGYDREQAEREIERRLGG